MQKIKNIEFLRIIGCLAIVMFHLFAIKYSLKCFLDIDLYQKLNTMAHNGSKAVDLFFIISGLFFSIKLNLAIPIWDFIKKKILRLYPVLLFVIILYLIVSLFGALEFTFYDNILTLLLLNGTNLILKLANATVFWYCSTLIWVLLLYYYLLKNYEKKNVNLIITLVIFFAYSFIIHTKNGGVGGNSSYVVYNFISLGVLRGLGGVGIGYLIGEWYKSNIKKIEVLKINLIQKLTITCVEFMCIYFMINNLMLHNLHYKNKFIFVVVFAICIILFLCKKGYISQALNDSILGDWSANIAKYTYSIYMFHYLLYETLLGSLWKYYPQIVYAHPVLNVVITIILAILGGVLIYHFVEEPCARYFKNKQAETPATVGGGGNLSI